MAPAAPMKPVSSVETKSALPPVSLEEIAELTKGTYSAARYAPQDIHDLREQAAEAYDSRALPPGYYPPTSKWDPRVQKKVALNHTPEQLAQHRVRGIKLATYVAKRGAALRMLPEEAWEQLHVIDGKVTMGAIAMASAIMTRRDCLGWEVKKTADEVTIKAIRLLPSGARVHIEVTVTRKQFQHLASKDNWKYYAADMLYYRAVTRVGKQGWPDAGLGLSTTEEARDERLARRTSIAGPVTAAAPAEVTPIIEDILQHMEEEAGIDDVNAPLPETPPAVGSQPGQNQSLTGDTPIESPEARLRAELATATTAVQCIELHRKAEEIEDAEARKKYRTDVLTRKEQLSAEVGRG